MEVSEEDDVFVAENLVGVVGWEGKVEDCVDGTQHPCAAHRDLIDQDDIDVFQIFSYFFILLKNSFNWNIPSAL